MWPSLPLFLSLPFATPVPALLYPCPSSSFTYMRFIHHFSSVSPFHLPSRKGSSKETSQDKVTPSTTENKLENKKHDELMDEELTVTHSLTTTKTTQKTTVSLTEEVKSHPLEDSEPEPDPLHKDSLSVSSESDSETTKKERPLSTHSNNTILWRESCGFLA